VNKLNTTYQNTTHKSSSTLTSTTTTLDYDTTKNTPTIIAQESNTNRTQLLHSWKYFTSTWVKAMNTNRQPQPQQVNTVNKEIQDLLQARNELLQGIHSMEVTLDGKMDDLHAMQWAVESDPCLVDFP